MKLRLGMGLILIVGSFLVGCDANRGKDVAGTDKKDAAPSTATAGEPDISVYDDFVVTYPESFDGEFNPDGLKVGPKVGQLAPEIEGVDLEGNEFKLSDYRGKVVMLDFYGDW